MQPRMWQLERILRALAKLTAVVKRGFLVESSYKFEFVMRNLRMGCVILLFYFASHLVGGPAARGIVKYGADYFGYVVVGMAVSEYLTSFMRTFGMSVSRAQSTGVLEALLSTRTKPTVVIIADSTFSLLMATLDVVVVLVASALLGVDYSHANVLSAIAVAALASAGFLGFGALSAA